MIRLATVFSGIGAIEHALYRMGLEHQIVFACDNGEVDILTKKIAHEIGAISGSYRQLETEAAEVRVPALASANQNIVFQFEYFETQKDLFAERLATERNKEVVPPKMLKDLAERLEMLIERLETVKVLLKL